MRARAWALELGAISLLWSALAGCDADPKGMPTRDHDPTTPNAPFVPSGAPPGAGSGAPSSPPAAGSGSLDAGSKPPASTMDSGTAQPGADSAVDAATADGGPLLPTVCADDDAGLPDEDAGAQDCIVVGDVKLQYRAADTNAADNQVKPHFNIVNAGTQTVDLKELTIRYWIADSEPAAIMFSCDYAQIGCGNVHGAFAPSDRSGGNRVLEVTFSGGTLAAKGSTGEIQTRWNHEGWALFDETDDYSFDPTKTAFADWYKVTLYQRGHLIWGLEPK